MYDRLAAALFLLVAVVPATALAESLTHGYVEGEFLWIGLPEGGVLGELSVERGNQVKAGDPLFALDDGRETSLREAARAALSAARARLVDLSKGSRESEITAARARLDEARAEQELARLTLARRKELRLTNAASEEALNRAEADFTRAESRTTQFQANLLTAGLAAREDQVAAATADVEQAEASLREQEWRLGQRRAAAPEDAVVEDTFYRPGEFVLAGRPVVSLLPPGNVKLRFFIPETAVATIGLGDIVAFSCDGCPIGLSARITYIAPSAEFTPPVIYSESARSKLVFLVEAVPQQSGTLRPGQPVDVVLP